jgi:hypothetical protein
MSEDEKANNKALREQLAKQGSIKTTILDKNIGSIRVDNTLKTIEILQADYVSAETEKELQKSDIKSTNLSIIRL